MRPAPVSIGQRFGRLVVVGLRQGPRQPNGRASGRVADVRCDCGHSATMFARQLAKHQDATCGRCSGKGRRHPSGIPGYVGAHHAVERARGKATDHHCELCGGPAAQWALKITTKHELYAELSGQNAGLVYATHPDAYGALCVTCHNREDTALPRSVRLHIRELITEDSRHTRGEA